MPKDKRPEIKPIRRKCAGCDKVKWVEHTSYIMPPAGSQFDIPIYNKNAIKIKRVDVPGVIVKYYCSLECAGDEFINKYEDADYRSKIISLSD